MRLVVCRLYCVSINGLKDGICHTNAFNGHVIVGLLCTRKTVVDASKNALYVLGLAKGACMVNFS